jgi:hydrogenase nickel incorporation protein HypA/HybF
MHEYSIVQALLDRVEVEARAHSATSVHRLRVQIGEQSGVEPDLLEAAFEMARMRTICETARLEIVSVAAQWACRVCGADIAPGQVLRCSLCDSPARLVSGDEIVLERIEMEAA